MNPWALFSLIIGISAIFLTIIIQVQSTIDKKIENKLQDPVFIKRIASEVQLPFLIFDEDMRYLADTGASALIKDIKIIKKDRDIQEIIVSPVKFLSIAPILESYDSDIEFEEPLQGKEFDWVYKTVLYSMKWGKSYQSGKPPRKRFKLQIIELSK